MISLKLLQKSKFLNLGFSLDKVPVLKDLVLVLFICNKFAKEFLFLMNYPLIFSFLRDQLKCCMFIS